MLVASCSARSPAPPGQEPALNADVIVDETPQPAPRPQPEPDEGRGPHPKSPESRPTRPSTEPWDAVPKPTASRPIFAEGQASFATVKDVADQFERALDESDYTRRWWFRVPNGFALLTELEQVDAAGEPLPGGARWIPGFIPPSFSESPGEWFKYLAQGKRGHYRFFALVVTDARLPVGAAPKEANIDAWEWSNPDVGHRPEGLDAMPYTAEHRSTAYIYYFVRRHKQDPLQFVGPGAIFGPHQRELPPELMKALRRAPAPTGVP